MSSLVSCSNSQWTETYPRAGKREAFKTQKCSYLTNSGNLSLQDSLFKNIQETDNVVCMPAGKLGECSFHSPSLSGLWTTSLIYHTSVCNLSPVHLQLTSINSVCQVGLTWNPYFDSLLFSYLGWIDMLFTSSHSSVCETQTLPILFPIWLLLF